MKPSAFSARLSSLVLNKPPCLELEDPPKPAGPTSSSWTSFRTLPVTREPHTFSQMLSQVREFGLHMILANQSTAQLEEGLQTALGTVQAIVAFRVSRADAEALGRVLGRVDTRAVKQETFQERRRQNLQRGPLLGCSSPIVGKVSLGEVKPLSQRS